MHDACFAGHRFRFLPERALFWHARRALLVADLHLEKASWFARHGQLLPPFDSHATLEQLVTLADRCEAAEIWALGDSFHDDGGPDRLDDAALTLTQRLARGRRLVWIAGNHDKAAHLPGERLEEAVVDNLVLRHEAIAGETRYEISGHFHPKHHVHTAGRSVSRPCFAVTPHRIILPAFGALTGGLDVKTPALRQILGDRAEAWVASRTALYRYPLNAGVGPVAKRQRTV